MNQRAQAHSAAEIRAMFHDDDAPVRVKCCGIMSMDDVRAVNAAHPDLCGFLVDAPAYAHSITSDRLKELTPALDPDIVAVGEFIDAPVSRVVQLAVTGIVDAVQLHGHEDKAYIMALRAQVDVPIIQAFPITDYEDIMAAETSSADLVLIDDDNLSTDEAFDWSLLQNVERPFIVAGGLNAENVVGVVSEVRPWGVNFNTGLETNGVKDAAKIEACVKAARG